MRPCMGVAAQPDNDDPVSYGGIQQQSRRDVGGGRNTDHIQRLLRCVGHRSLREIARSRGFNGSLLIGKIACGSVEYT